jgi:hypothetical protein
VLEECNQYFDNRPYDWFDDFSPILEAFNTSYYDRTACHLDLVQWATDPVWSKIAFRGENGTVDRQKSEEIRNKLIKDDAAFLR